MKKIIAILSVITILATVFYGCGEPKETTSTEATTQETTEIETDTETDEITEMETESDTTEATTSTDEFPTESNDNDDSNNSGDNGNSDDGTDTSSNNYTEPGKRWSANVPTNVWDTYGEILEDASKTYVRFVYKKAYDEYQAGHVFTIYTVDAANKVDVSTYPHAEQIYLDDNIQIYVDYPTDVQYGGIDGSEIESQGKEYKKLKDTTSGIINSIKVL